MYIYNMYIHVCIYFIDLSIWHAYVCVCVSVSCVYACVYVDDCFSRVPCLTVDECVRVYVCHMCTASLTLLVCIVGIVLSVSHLL